MIAEASSLGAAARKHAKELAEHIQRALPYLQARRFISCILWEEDADSQSAFFNRCAHLLAQPLQAAAGPLLRLNMALFYLHGVFYHPAFRLLGVRYIFVGKMLEV